MSFGSMVFAADDGSEFRVPVNADGTCGPLPKAGVMVRWEPPPMVGSVRFRDAFSAGVLADALRSIGYEVTTHRSDDR